jgi:histidinol-phosphate aminotransferase
MRVIDKFSGIVVVDEAYSDFCRQLPMRHELKRNPNLVVLNTMSKAWASAAIRLGMAYASTEIIGILNKVKYPYNVNQLTQQQAMKVLNDTSDIGRWMQMVLQERSHTMEAFRQLPICQKVYPTDANFFLARVTDAQTIYDYLVERGIIVRNRTRVQLCNNCLRITIGTRSENTELLGALRQYCS